jgi:peptidylprolyl isomerase
MSENLKLTFIIIVVVAVFAGGLSFINQMNSSNTKQIQQELQKGTNIATTTASTTQQINNKNNNQTMISATNNTTSVPSNVKGAVIHTNYGDIEVSFANNTPNTVNNFVTLAVNHYYDSIRFHRVIKGFMIQAGDPFSKDITNKAIWGTGGPGYKFADELTGNEKYTEGTLAMANAGPNTNGSQFFIVTANPSVALPPSYTVFGHVVSGMDVALKIDNVKTESPDRPISDVIIKGITLK